ncbi:hypothetical protein GGS20DRAFT_586124 [Poronia punctata]|nr:hypothetical protein GGS20DRAFT_586124 [Poronia punctata]
MTKSLVALVGGLLLVSSGLSFPTQIPMVGSELKRGISTASCGQDIDYTIYTTGDAEYGPGVYITNLDQGTEGHYFLYENLKDNKPWKHVEVPVGQRVFVAVCPSWQGRVVRGLPAVNLDGKPHVQGTLFESALAEDGSIFGDISFLRGCDGGGSVNATDGSNLHRECFSDLLSGPPEWALSTKDTGTKYLGQIIGDKSNGAAKDWMLSKCSADHVWINPANYNPIVKSQNGRLDFVFYKGKA